MAPKIRCFYDDCVFVDKGFCTASSIELDPEEGCLTYTEENLGEELFFEGDGAEDFEDDEDWDDAGFEELDDLEDIEDEE
jgi:hypothetical protein